MDSLNNISSVKKEDKYDYMTQSYDKNPLYH